MNEAYDYGEAFHAGDGEDAQGAVAIDAGRSAMLSNEVTAYAVLFVLGLIARLVALEQQPLTLDEAAAALSAVRGEPVGPSPLLHNAGWLFAAVLGSELWVVRLPVALCGALLPVAAWWLRPLMGRTAALGVASLFALAPMWVVWSRSFDPLAPLALAVLVAIGAVAAGRGTVAAAAVGIALAITGPVWSIVAAGAVAVGLYAATSEASALRAFAARVLPTKATRRRAALVFGVALVLGSTGLLRPAGLATLVEGPLQWWRSMGPEAVAWPAGAWLTLAIYAPVLSGFGAVGLVMVARNHRVAPWLLPWVAIGFMLTAWFGTASAAATLMLPLTIAAGAAVGALIKALAARFTWGEDGVMVWILLVVMGYALIHAWQYAQVGISATQRNDWTLMTGALAMALVLIGAFAVLWGPPMAARVGGLAALVVGLCIGWSNGARLGWGAELELWRPQGIMPGAMHLSRELDQLATVPRAAVAGNNIVVDARLRPTLGWALRGQPAVRWGSLEGSSELPASIVVTMDDATPPTGVDLDGVRHYEVATYWDGRFATTRGFVQWLLQRRPPVDDGGLGEIGAPRIERATVWVRHGVFDD